VAGERESQSAGTYRRRPDNLEGVAVAGGAGNDRVHLRGPRISASSRVACRGKNGGGPGRLMCRPSYVTFDGIDVKERGRLDALLLGGEREPVAISRSRTAICEERLTLFGRWWAGDRGWALTV